ncbi:MAG: hypothetical protein RBT11_14285 [Desulfobacterales bacterium]|jgi:hypothetical protein|nr:hypothetical protein [Desulfobacterales bacterium]
MQGPFLRKYGVQTTIDFTLYSITGLELKTNAVFASGDTYIMRDEGPEVTTTYGFVDEGNGYSIALSATEMQAARIVVYVVDQGTKAWIDTAIMVETYGNTSAQHAMDFDDAVRGGMTALPNAAADAAGGLPISDAGGLDLDTFLARLTGNVATASELDKVPNSDNTVSWNATALAALADAVSDEVQEGTITIRQMNRLILAVLTGKTTGGGTDTLGFRDIADTKTRLSVTVDSNNNRTAIGVRDGS